MSTGTNSNRIRKAFERILFRKDTEIENALRTVLDKAVPFALQAHDEFHQHHLDMGDTYGWMIAHDGEIIDMKTFSGRYEEGDIRYQLETCDIPQKGWVGVVMAGMQPSSYFAVDYEVSVLDDTIEMTKPLFRSLFRTLRLQ